MKKLKSMSKSKKIRALLDKGKTVSYIAGVLKVKPNYVYSVRWHMKKKKPGKVASTSRLGKAASNSLKTREALASLRALLKALASLSARV